MAHKGYQLSPEKLEQIYGVYQHDLAANFTATLRSDTYSFISPANVDHSGHYVLVTGASKAIGYAIALSFAKSGASGIALLARSPLDKLEQEIAAAAQAAGKPKPQVLKLYADITNQHEVEAAAAEYSKHFPRLDILVNNAGYLAQYDLIKDADPVDWWQSFEINVKGTFLVTRTFLPRMFKSSLKTILNMSSSTAFGPSPGASSYAVTKLVLSRLAELISIDCEEEGMISFSLHPGGVKSEMSRKLPDMFESFLNDAPELAADTVSWLTSERREWLCGRYINAGWDMEEFLARRDEIVKNGWLKVRLTVPDSPGMVAT